MIRVFLLSLTAFSLTALLLAAPAFAADGDCVPFWQCGTRPASPQAARLTPSLAEFNDDVYNPYSPFKQPVRLAADGDVVPTPPWA